MRPFRLPSIGVVLVAVLIAAACGGANQPSSVTWRNVTLHLPDGWYVFENEDTRLSISNADIGPALVDGQTRPRPEGDIVAMFLTYEPRTIPDDWRAHVADLGGTMESDDQIMLSDDVPATRMVFTRDNVGATTREMVVVIPSRAIVMLAQPVPDPGDTDAPEVFLEYIETFLDILDAAEFGAPVLD